MASDRPRALRDARRSRRVERAADAVAPASSSRRWRCPSACCSRRRRREHGACSGLIAGIGLLSVLYLLGVRLRPGRGAQIALHLCDLVIVGALRGRDRRARQPVLLLRPRRRDGVCWAAFRGPHHRRGSSVAVRGDAVGRLLDAADAAGGVARAIDAGERGRGVPGRARRRGTLGERVHRRIDLERTARESSCPCRPRHRAAAPRRACCPSTEAASSAISTAARAGAGHSRARSPWADHGPSVPRAPGPLREFVLERWAARRVRARRSSSGATNRRCRSDCRYRSPTTTA